jgi:tRNA1Val (adenine37-N6)-methyltransferase
MNGQGIFSFKQFNISHTNSSMKVGTDATLLGSWVDVSNTKKILDIGTGCGIIALMLAQRSNARIDAIDIDKASIKEATSNFNNSPWPFRLHSHHTSLQSYQMAAATKYDLIVSNPPFFQNSLLPKKENLRLAKHNTALTYTELFKASVALLTTDGRLTIILPFDDSENVTELANACGLHLQQQLSIFNTSNKPAKRIILGFGLSIPIKVEVDQIVIRDLEANFTAEYRQLTEAFHPDFV